MHGAGVSTKTCCYVYEDGTVTVSVALERTTGASVSGDDVPPPLRAGVTAKWVRERAEVMTWYGRGPHESYPDRFASAPLRVWQQEVAGATFRYVRPQENGNRLDTRWLALSEVGASAGDGSAGGRQVGGVGGALIVSLVGDGGHAVKEARDEGCGGEGAVAVPALSMQCHHFDLDDFDSVPQGSAGEMGRGYGRGGRRRPE